MPTYEVEERTYEVDEDGFLQNAEIWNEAVALDFARADTFERHHYCFRVGDAEFDAVFGRLRAAGIAHRSRPNGPDDLEVNTRLGGRNIYWNDADGHVWEILTVSYARPRPSTAGGAG